MGVKEQDTERRERRERIAAERAAELPFGEPREGTAHELQPGDFIETMGDGRGYRRYRINALLLGVCQSSDGPTTEIRIGDELPLACVPTYPVRYRRRESAA